MPNEKVSYFKPIEEIKDKIVYVKDKDLMGFDTANIYAFHLGLYNMTKFGLSDNFILMDDDYFIGKPIKKSQFFYYDEKEKKVLPFIVSNNYNELKKEDLYIRYNKLYSKIKRLDPHSSDGCHFHMAMSLKLIVDNFEQPLIEPCFTHNAIPLNLNDIKEIFEFIKQKYEYFNITYYSKTRPIFCLQSHTLFMAYTFNVKKRKVNIINQIFHDLKYIEKNNDLNFINVELFVINTSGEVKYNAKHFDYLKGILKLKFNKPTPYEIIPDKNDSNDKEEIKDVYSLKRFINAKYSSSPPQKKFIFENPEKKADINIINKEDAKKIFEEIKIDINNYIKNETKKLFDGMNIDIDNYIKNETKKIEGELKIDMNNYIKNEIKKLFEDIKLEANVNIKNETKKFIDENDKMNKDEQNFTNNETKNVIIINSEKKINQLHFQFKLLLILLIIAITANILLFACIRFCISQNNKYQKIYLNDRKELNQEENNI